MIQTFDPAMPSVKNAVALDKCREKALCQAKVPVPLYAAVRKQLEADGVPLRRFMRWALMEYLRLRDPKAAEEAWNKCI